MNEVPQPVTYIVVIGSSATQDKPVPAGSVTLNVTRPGVIDSFKEREETFAVNIATSDDCIWLGRDLVLVRVPENGGILEPHLSLYVL